MSLLRQSVAALLAAVLVSTPVASAPAQSPSPPQPPEQQTASTSPFDATENCIIPAPSERSQHYFPSYLEDSFTQLKAAVPTLRSLKFEDHPSTSPEGADPILDHAAEALVAMVPKVPNLIAREELSQTSLTLPYVPGSIVPTSGNPGRRNAAPIISSSTSASGEVVGEELNRVLETKLETPQPRNIFSYRIRSTEDPVLGPLLEEYRINAKEQAVGRDDFSAGNPRSVGYGSTWLMFVPDNLNQAHFRLLGHQKIDKHETTVLAFAQDPAVATLRATVKLGAAPGCRYMVQGILWIDDSLFNIVRIRTDLLAPLTGVQITQLRSELQFSEVKIPSRNLTLWLPHEVRISWQGKNDAGMELHRYSNYRLFAATSRIVLDPDQVEPTPPPQ